MATFRELLQLSFKSEDTEEWLDVHFTRPIGLVFALLWNRLGIHPNAITILSIFLGIGAGWMFHFTDWLHNLYGVILLMLANFCDSTDGQMARLTGKKTLVGRVLDGFSGDVWFAAIYIGIIVRLWHQPVPGMTFSWGIGAFLLAVVASLGCHAPQCALADYVPSTSSCPSVHFSRVCSIIIMPTTVRVRNVAPPVSSSSSHAGTNSRPLRCVNSSCRAAVR